MTLCLVELHFGSCPVIQSFGFTWTLTIPSALISRYFRLLFALFCKCKFTQRWCFSCFIRLYLSNGMLCRVIFFLIMLSICLNQSLLVCFKASNLRCKLSLKVLIRKTLNSMSMSRGLNRFDFSLVNEFYHLWRPHRTFFIWI